ncbi:MAG: hypothetical protein IJJ23_07845 [Clostridia bacterium]|nr:hypothetical protein [Clostridia bacterium]
MTALGVCLFQYENAVYKLERVTDIVKGMNYSDLIMTLIGICIAILSMPFVFFCLVVFWNSLISVFRKSHFLSGISTTEWIVYSIILLTTMLFMTLIFSKTNAFYGTQYYYDTIYTSDSMSLVKGNAYLSLRHQENDLRQPLFAIFSAPFSGFPYLFGKLVGKSEAIQAISLNCTQIILLFVSQLILAKTISLSPQKRICFVTLSSATYTYMLFTLMMEQYVVAYFWLILCIHQIILNDKPDRIALWGASGTLLTSSILIFKMPSCKLKEDRKRWIRELFNYGFEFVLLIALFCRADVLLSAISRITSLSRFGGGGVSIFQRQLQYIEFVHNIFCAPKADVNLTDFGHISWQLLSVKALNLVGVIILLLAIFSGIVNRENKSSRIAGNWIVFSYLILSLLGWGTKENGLILYSLYFGWAFYVLLFQLFEKIEKKLSTCFIVPLVSLTGFIILVSINAPAIIEMVNFAIENYPV